MSFGFQNPGDGYPLYLSEQNKNGQITVEAEEVEDMGEPTESTKKDMVAMNRAIRNCKDVHDAVDILIRDFGADIC